MNCPHCETPLATGSRFCGKCGRAAIETTEVDPVGETVAPSLIGREIVGRYRIKSKLGEGGMGAVFKAEQISLKRVVALKLLKPELVSSAPLLRRFNAEAEAVAKLSHPNTVGIYDFGQDRDGTLFIAMELVEGKSLRATLIGEGPFQPLRALHITGQIAASLSDAHALGIIHRDLKPDNIMLQERGRQRDVVRVLDFGIAKLRDDSRMTQQSMTQAGDVLGTPQYMSPEQIRGEEIDGRADVYSLGAMLYEMLTGRMVFEASSLVALLSKHLLDQPEPPSRRRPDLRIAAELDELVLACLAKDPRGRPASMDGVAERVAQLAQAHGAVMSSSDAHAFRPPSQAQGAPSSGEVGTGGGHLPAAMIVPTGTPGAPPSGYGPPPGPPPPGPAGFGTPSGPPYPMTPASMPQAMQPMQAMQQPTPAPYSAPHSPPPSAPYPSPHQPHSGYGGAPTPPPPGDPSYGAYSPMAAPAPAYAPFVSPEMQPFPPRRPEPSRAGLWIALVALLLAGGGTGAYFFFIKEDKPKAATVDGPDAPDSPWGSGGSAAPGPGPGPAPGPDPSPRQPDDPGTSVAADPNRPMKPPKIVNVGGQLYSKSGAFRFLVPPELSAKPAVKAADEATTWTFAATDDPLVTVSVIATDTTDDLDLDDPEAVAEAFGASIGMQLTSWSWRPIQGQRALSASYHYAQGGVSLAVEAVLYVKAKGALVVLFTCDASAFEDSRDYRDSIFTQRISW